MHKNIKLYTEVPVETGLFRIGHFDPIFLLGSCFTENMGQRLADLNFLTHINPFGILYNPLSLATAMEYCLDDKRIGEDDLVFRDDLWHSWLHHGSFSKKDKQECLDTCNRAINDAYKFLHTCNTIIVTFGSAWYYQLKDNCQLSTINCQLSNVVANCHKVPAAQFEKRLASVDQVVDAWKPIIERLTKRGMRIIFTISPVRHQAYGAHGNQLGKAVLLLAIDQLNCQLSTVNYQLTYFPAYEIVTDELRDYRFYADDMAHPSALAEQIVWQRFQETFMTPETIDRCNDYDKMNRRNAHRTLH